MAAGQKGGYMARFVEFHQGKRKILINVRAVEGVFVDDKDNTVIITTSCVEEEAQWMVDEPYQKVKQMLTGKMVE